MVARALVLSCGVAVAVAATAAAAPTTLPGQRKCGDKAVTVLFWPQGHGVISSLGFPASRKPHLELYRYAAARTYLPGNQLGFAEARGRYQILAAHCKGDLVTAPAMRTFGTSKRFDRKLTATCSTLSGARLLTQKIGTTGWEIKLLDGASKVLLRAQIKPSGSTLSATEECRVGPAPS